MNETKPSMQLSAKAEAEFSEASGVLADEPEETKQNVWDAFVDRVRLATPAFFVNESARLSYGLRASADILSIKSGMRPAVLNDEKLHGTFFAKYPEKLPKGYNSYVRGMRLGMSAPDRAAGGLITLGGLLLGVVYGEKPMTQEERDAISEMPVSEYVPMRLKQAFNPKEHSAATAGLATIANGALLTRAGFKQYNGLHGRFNWRKLPLEAFQGMMTMAAGASLQFIPDQERAWQVSKAIFFYRAPVAAGQAWRAWDSGIPGKVDPGDWEQGGKWVLNQTANYVGMFYGGVEKRDDQIIRVSKDTKRAPTPQLLDHNRPHMSQAPAPNISTSEIALDKLTEPQQKAVSSA